MQQSILQSRPYELDSFVVFIRGNVFEQLWIPSILLRARTFQEFNADTPGGSVRGERANFTRLVHGCIEAKVCKYFSKYSLELGSI